MRSGDPSATVTNLYDMVAGARGLLGDQLPVEERTVLAGRALEVMYADLHFEIVPDSGRGVEPMELVPYDPAWPVRFQEWRARLAPVLESSARRIDHVGSTSVPGLAAKPVIDIQVSMADLQDEAGYVPMIESLGVQLRSRDDEQRYFRPFPGRPRDVHIHACVAGSTWERRHLLFVAFLRDDVTARVDYLQAKQIAMARWVDDRVAYTQAKDDVIRDITARAEEWAARVGWTPEASGRP
ncbi:MAG TPA: GrpB family protein [Candidatus Dormibacteraeota bacterium]